ncbi:uncharacterized protein V1510DRAFT_367272 [Dipodascopsis tothii]|uniref:uncharacterized protein n=1 Tax=Dipodascopsis tothii TaxID=44089 RepID=UPI0034CE181A
MSEIDSLATETTFAALAASRPGLARSVSTRNTSPAGSLANRTARLAAAHMDTGRRPAQGGRVRRRLENARMLSNPHAVPPAPSDYRGPGYAVRTDWAFAEYLHAFRQAQGQIAPAAVEPPASADPRLSRALKERLKRGHLTEPFLRGLEEKIRDFVVGASVLGQRLAGGGTDPSLGRLQKAHRTLVVIEKELEIEADDARAEAFVRWVAHELAAYYRVLCYAKPVGDRDVLCVGVDAAEGDRAADMPRPVWTYV